jgi:hypothetical protein
MPWYAITSWDIEEVPMKREILCRDSIDKVWQFIGGRCDRRTIPDGVCGYTITEAIQEETWDWDEKTPKPQAALAEEVPLLKYQTEMGADAYLKKLGFEK